MKLSDTYPSPYDTYTLTYTQKILLVSMLACKNKQENVCLWNKMLTFHANIGIYCLQEYHLIDRY